MLGTCAANRPIADVAILTWVGAQAIEPATVMLGQIATAYLFLCLTGFWSVFQRASSGGAPRC